MDGCSDGCSDCQFTADHPMAKNFWIWRFASEFEKVGCFFQNVVGEIDGLHLEMESTEERIFETSFINYKQFPSSHLQVSSVRYQINQYLVLVNYPSTYTMYWLKYVSRLVKLLRKKWPYKSVFFSCFITL